MTWDDHRLTIPTRPSTDWCGGNCSEGHDGTFRIVGESNGWSGELTYDHPNCCNSPGRYYYYSFDRGIADNTKTFPLSATSVSWDNKTFKIFEDGGSEGCGDYDRTISMPGNTVSVSQLICDGVARQFSAVGNTAQCGTMKIRRMYKCQRSSAVCGEASCVGPDGLQYVSHFSGTGCTGTEYYYAAYFNSGYNCRPDSSSGAICGTNELGSTNTRSYRQNGICNGDPWPGGNYLTGLVRVYR